MQSVFNILPMVRSVARYAVPMRLIAALSSRLVRW